MRILFLTDNYPPEVNAPASRTHFHCREWVRAGVDVTVVTCAPNFPQGRVYEGYRNRPIQTEWVEGVRVVRVWSYMAPNAGFTRRILDYISFAISATLVGLFQRFDVLVATSPQFFTVVAGAAVAGLKRKPWIFELRDLWPESIVATGAMEPGPVVDLLQRLELDLYRSAAAVVPVTHSFRENLVSRGVPPRKITVVTNGADQREFDTGRNGGGWRVGLHRPFRVGYLGTHGLAHGLDLVLRAAELVDPSEAEFILVGDGAERGRLMALARTRGLDHVRFRPPVPRDQVPDVLADFDACLVPLRDSETFRSVIPSKVFEAAAARRPILLGVRGEVEELVADHGAGLSFRPESETDLAAAIRRLRTDPALYADCQAGGSRMAAAFDRRGLAAEMLRVLRAASSAAAAA